MQKKRIKDMSSWTSGSTVSGTCFPSDIVVCERASWAAGQVEDEEEEDEDEEGLLKVRRFMSAASSMFAQG